MVTQTRALKKLAPAMHGGRVAAKSQKARSSRPTASSIDVRSLRQSLGLNRKLFSRLCQYSERAIAEWESGERLAAPSKQRMLELARLQQALASVMEEDFISDWLQTPNDAFDGLKPLEIIERGHIDRIWRMIYQMESGVPA